MQDGPTGNTPSNDPHPGPPPQKSPPSSYAQGEPYTPANHPFPHGYAQHPYPPPGTVFVGEGLSDTTAGALAYVTIIPAIVFLLVAPYNVRPFVKFHAFQCLGLFALWFCLGLIAVIPILGWIVWLLGSIALCVVWVLSLVKASQGSYLKLPVISDFASQQSGYRVM